MRVANFLLADQNLEAHELYRLADAPVVVLVTQANGDAVIQKLPSSTSSLPTMARRASSS